MSIIFSKRFHSFEHDFDGIAHSLEINNHLQFIKRFGQIEFMRNKKRQRENPNFQGPNDHSSDNITQYLSANTRDGGPISSLIDRLKPGILTKLDVLNFSHKLEDYYADCMSIQLEYMNNNSSSLNDRKKAEDELLEQNAYARGLSNTENSMFFPT